uniref:RNA-directed DNA polymerase n=2 Tax=Trichobilharzia regenti TaxID=157069 RepID=A0AA85KGR0_TRIRE|nr:unnamed protein product [Trichobilharzia regenti]
MNVPHPNAFVIDSVGRSLEMYTIGLDYVHMPLTTLLSTLIARIVPPIPPIEALKRFSECNQRQGESINQFTLRLRKLARQAMQDKTHSEVESAIYSKFLQGVDVRYRKDFNLHTPASMTEAEARARLMESLEEPGTTCPQVNAMGYQHTTTKHAQNPTPPWKGRPQSQSTSRNDCYYCRRFGKLARSCGHNAGESHVDMNCVPTVNLIGVTSSPKVVGYIGGKKCVMLVDSGATCSVVHSSCVPETFRPTIGTHNLRLTTANGDCMQSQGLVLLPLKLGTLSLQHNFIISTRVPWQVILGVDLLEKLSGIIDCSHRTLILKDCSIPFIVGNDKEHGTFGVQGDAKTEKQRMLTTIEPLPSETAANFNKMLDKYEDCFDWDGKSPGRTKLVQHHIETGNAPPCRQPARRVPAHYQKELNRLVDELLEKNVIKPSVSPWASPVVLVKKSNGTLRLCVDYHDTFDALEGSNWFTTLDLASGYWQVEVHPDDRQKTAFIVQAGLYEFETMPFGLVNAPATFQRLMQTVLSDCIPGKCLVYLDDVIIHSKTLTEHLSDISEVLERMQTVGLKLNPSKCQFFRKEVCFLGHIVSAEGIKCDPAKVQEVKDWPLPNSAPELHSFLGLASYYRRFVLNFSFLAAPLFDILKKKDYNWTASATEAFERLKNCLCSPPILAYPNVSDQAGPFILDTDASDSGIGAVLSQKDADGVEKVIAYASRALNKSEKNYCTTRKEMLALVNFVKHFRAYLLGRHFIVRTDHKALSWLHNFKEAEGQIARWQEHLQEYDFECMHRPGKNHGNADALSRKPLRYHGDCPSCTEAQVSLLQLEAHTSYSWPELQSSDPELALIYERVRNGGERPTTQEIGKLGWETRCLWSLWDNLKIVDDILYYQHGPTYTRRVVAPQSALPTVLLSLHQQLGHAGSGKMIEAAKRRYWWPHQRKDIIDFCDSCEVCQTIKAPHKYNKAPLEPIIAGHPNDLVQIDLVGPLPVTSRNNNYILVMVDHFTKWCEAIAIPQIDAVTIAESIFDHWVSRWGAPLQLHSDRGSNFESIVVSELCRIMGIRKTRTTAYHPQGNGLVERTNRTLKALLQAFVDQNNPREWDRSLSQCLMAYRASIHKATRQTPHYMVTGRELRLPIDLTSNTLGEDTLIASEHVIRLRRNLNKVHQMTRDILQTNQRYQKEYYDRKAHGSPVEPGDKVMLLKEAPPKGKALKFHKRWEGPFTVVEVLSDCTCRIQEPNSSHSLVTHFNRLKPFRQQALEQTSPAGTVT